MVDEAAPDRTIDSPDWIMTFGKHKGHTVEYVIEHFPQYVAWAHSNIAWFKLSKPLIRILRESLDAKPATKAPYHPAAGEDEDRPW